jgi:alkylation response protein AidB-like acyl-CoA dehydrogenase
MDLSLTDQQQSFREKVSAFSAEHVAPYAAAIDDSNAFPMEVVRAAASLGLMGVTIPDAHGGAGRDYLSYPLALEELAPARKAIYVIPAVNN